MANNEFIGAYWHPQQDIIPDALIVQQKRVDVWRPTKKGFYINPRLAKFTANENNSSKLELINAKYNASANGGPAWEQPIGSSKQIFVTSISINWSLRYTQGQGPFGKSFYPHDVLYTSCVIKGQTKSQHDYDELVSWVLGSQKSAMQTAFNYVRYTLPGRAHLVNKDVSVLRFPYVTFNGYIKNIKAGHRVKNFSPTFELEFLLLSFNQGGPGKKDFAITDGTDNPLLSTDYGADPASILVDSFKISQSAIPAQTGYLVLPNDSIIQQGGDENFYAFQPQYYSDYQPPYYPGSGQ